MLPPLLGVAASCSILSMCIPSVFLGSSLGLPPGNYQLASAEHQYQFTFQHLLSSGPSTQYRAVPSLGLASWLLPPQCSRTQVGEKPPSPPRSAGGVRHCHWAPWAQEISGTTVQASPLRPRSAPAGQGPGLSGGQVTVILGAPLQCPPPVNWSATLVGPYSLFLKERDL